MGLGKMQPDLQMRAVQRRRSGSRVDAVNAKIRMVKDRMVKEKSGKRIDQQMFHHVADASAAVGKIGESLLRKGVHHLVRDRQRDLFLRPQIPDDLFYL